MKPETNYERALREVATLQQANERMRKALEEIKRHHVRQNKIKGLPSERSYTLAVVRAALAEAGKETGQ